MIAFRLTIVLTPNGRVVSQQARIIGSGPIATTSSTFSFSRTSFRAAVTKPGRPYVPSSVQTIRSSQYSRNFVLPEDEVLRAEADDPRDPVAGLLEGAQLREDGRDAEAAADEDDVARLLDVARQAEGSDEVEERVALGVVPEHLLRRLADGLDDHRDRSPVAVEVRHGQGDALAPLAQPDHHEVARLGRPRDVGGVDVPEEGRVRELLAADDSIHGPEG